MSGLLARCCSTLSIVASLLLLVLSLLVVPPVLWFNWIGISGYFFPRTTVIDPLSFGHIALLIFYDAALVLIICVAWRALGHAMAVGHARRRAFATPPVPRLVQWGLWAVLLICIAVGAATLVYETMRSGDRRVPYLIGLPALLALVTLLAFRCMGRRR